jgi:hypothetical protein
LAAFPAAEYQPRGGRRRQEAGGSGVTAVRKQWAVGSLDDDGQNLMMGGTLDDECKQKAP